MPKPPKLQAKGGARAVAVDTTGDGRADSICVDTNGDGNADSLFPIVGKSRHKSVTAAAAESHRRQKHGKKGKSGSNKGNNRAVHDDSSEFSEDSEVSEKLTSLALTDRALDSKETPKSKKKGPPTAAQKRWNMTHDKLKATREFAQPAGGDRRNTTTDRETILTVSFAPRCVVEQIERTTKFDDAKGQHVFDAKSAGRQISGAVLMLDASGFTALTERLSVEKNGAELMCKIINEYFSKLIDIVLAYGGDVVKFAGDALLVVFHVSDNTSDGMARSMEEAVQRAVQASMDIHSKLNAYPAWGDVTLSLHMGVGCGQLTTLHVGGVFERYEFIVAGAPMKQIAVAEPTAKRGETVVSPEVAEYLMEMADMVEATPEGGETGFMRVLRLTRRLENVSEVENYDREVSIDTVRQVRKYIPGAVTARFKAGDVRALTNVQMVAEMRDISVLFIVTNNYDITAAANEGVKAATDKAQMLMLEIQRHVFAQEGSINKMLVDDKGLLTIAVFGLPPLPHHDDPLRAVRAAVAIRKGVSKLAAKVQCCVGVTSGVAFCGVIGSERRREYTVMGDIVNLSARLMAAAAEHAPKEGVLVDTATFAASRMQYGFCESLPPIKVKGKKKAVAIYAPTEDLSGAQRVENLGLDGRGPEVRIARANVATLCVYHNGGTMVITGQSGCGRSRIVCELGAIAAEAKLAFLGKEKPDWNFLTQLNMMLRLKQHPAGVKSNQNGDTNSSVMLKNPDKVTPTLIKGLVEGGGVFTPFTYSLLELLEHCPKDWSDKPGVWLLSLLPKQLRTNASDLNGILTKDLIPRQKGYREMKPGERQNNLAILLIALFEGFAETQPCFILLHLRTGTGSKSAQDRESWTVASKIASRIKKRKSKMPPMILCVTANPIPENRLDELPLEVADVVAEAKRTDTLQNLPPFNTARRDQHLLDVLATDHGYDLGIAEIPSGIVQYVRDFASGAPHYISLLVRQMMDEGTIKMDRRDILLGGGIEVVVMNPDLVHYSGHTAEHENLAEFNDLRDYETICNVPRKLRGTAREKLDNLTEKDQRLLKVASVMCSFSSKMLATLMFINDRSSAPRAEDVMEMLDLLIAEQMLERNLTVGEYVLMHDFKATVSFKFQCRLVQIEASKRTLQGERDKLVEGLQTMMIENERDSILQLAKSRDSSRLSSSSIHSASPRLSRRFSRISQISEISHFSVPAPESPTQDGSKGFKSRNEEASADSQLAVEQMRPHTNSASSRNNRNNASHRGHVTPAHDPSRLSPPRPTSRTRGHTPSLCPTPNGQVSAADIKRLKDDMGRMQRHLEMLEDSSKPSTPQDHFPKVGCRPGKNSSVCVLM